MVQLQACWGCWAQQQEGALHEAALCRVKACAEAGAQTCAVQDSAAACVAFWRCATAAVLLVAPQSGDPPSSPTHTPSGCLYILPVCDLCWDVTICGTVKGSIHQRVSDDAPFPSPPSWAAAHTGSRH